MDKETKTKILYFVVVVVSILAILFIQNIMINSEDVFYRSHIKMSGDEMSYEKSELTLGDYFFSYILGFLIWVVIVGFIALFFKIVSEIVDALKKYLFKKDLEIPKE